MWIHVYVYTISLYCSTSIFYCICFTIYYNFCTKTKCTWCCYCMICCCPCSRCCNTCWPSTTFSTWTICCYFINSWFSWCSRYSWRCSWCYCFCLNLNYFIYWFFYYFWRYFLSWYFYIIFISNFVSNFLFSILPCLYNFICCKSRTVWNIFCYCFKWNFFSYYNYFFCDISVTFYYLLCINVYFFYICKFNWFFTNFWYYNFIRICNFFF
mgnify:CR=1 FL=1